MELLHVDALRDTLPDMNSTFGKTNLMVVIKSQKAAASTQHLCCLD